MEDVWLSWQAAVIVLCAGVLIGAGTTTGGIGAGGRNVLYWAAFVLQVIAGIAAFGTAICVFWVARKVGRKTDELAEPKMITDLIGFLFPQQ